MTKAFEKIHAFKNYKEYFAKISHSFWEGLAVVYTAKFKDFLRMKKFLTKEWWERVARECFSQENVSGCNNIFRDTETFFKIKKKFRVFSKEKDEEKEDGFDRQ